MTLPDIVAPQEWEARRTALGDHWSLLDLTPLGRHETWEDTPAGRPPTHPYEWWRLHDEH